MSVALAVRAATSLITPGRIVLIGELHGTYEYPAVVAGLAAEATRTHAVLVGLELPRSEQQAVEQFLSSDGSSDAVRQLLRSDWWHPPPHFDDGRPSDGMLKLLATLRALVTAGRQLTVCAYDLPFVTVGKHLPADLADLFGQPRDAVMASALQVAINRQPDAFVIVLAGNEHTRFAARPSGQHPLGAHLVDATQDVVALLGHSHGGTFRAATSPIGASEHTVYANDTPIGLGWYTNTREEAHHGWINVGRLTAAPPATNDRPTANDGPST